MMLEAALPINIIPRLQRFQFSLTLTQGVALGYYISRLWRCVRGVLNRSIIRSVHPVATAPGFDLTLDVGLWTLD
jgi:hypothetical protein